MKTFFKFFFGLLIFELLFGILNSFIFLKTNFELLSCILNFVEHLYSMPLYLLDKTYPFYAEGTLGFQFGLMFINLSIQTIILYLLLDYYKRKIKNK